MLELASCDGTNRLTLHVGYVVKPTALTLDLPTRTLFWVDGKLHIIASSDYYGQNCRQVLASGVRHALGLAVFENRLYWSSGFNSAMYSASLQDGHNFSVLEDGTLQEHVPGNVTTLYQDLFYPMGVRVVHPLLQPETEQLEPCSMASLLGKECEYLCLLSSESAEGYSCACPPGKKANGAYCESKSIYTKDA